MNKTEATDLNLVDAAIDYPLPYFFLHTHCKNWVKKYISCGYFSHE